MNRLWRWLGVVVFLFSGGAAQAAGLTFQGHRAVYDLTLKRSEQGSSVSNLSGRLVMEWLDGCDGAILNHRMLTEMTDTGGRIAVSDYQASTWESPDGRKFRYNSRSEINGKPDRKFKGEAYLDAKEEGLAEFVEPEAKTLALPAGTTFPTELMRKVLRAARDGKRTINVRLFDGSDAGALFDTFSVIGNVREADPPSADAPALLAGVRSWPVQMAYFPVSPKRGAPQDVPIFEVAFRLYQNGVSTELVLDYGHIAMVGELKQLDAVPSPGC